MRKLFSFSFLFLFFFIFPTDGFYNIIASGFAWAEKAGGTGMDYGLSIATDSLENSYVTGSFSGAAIFGGASMVSYGELDIFITKLDKSGNFTWARKAGGTGDDMGNGIAADRHGNSYITGYFNGSANFGTIILESGGTTDVFAAKLDNNGNFLWAVRAGGPGYCMGNSIALDASGNIYITGYFSGTADFGTSSLVSQGSRDIFIAKIDDDGNFLWAKSAGGSGDDIGNGIDVDIDGNPYITGYFNDTANFDSFTAVSNGSSDIFIAKLNTTGTFIWVKSAGGTDYDESKAITINPAGFCYITGAFKGTSYFAPGNSVVSSGLSDIFIAIYGQEDGNFFGVIAAGGPTNDLGLDIVNDSLGNAYVVGCFSGTAYFDTFPVVSDGGFDIFIAKMNLAGPFEWVESAGGASGNIGFGIALDPYGKLSITGIFTTTAGFGGTNLISSGENDVFIAKYNTDTTLVPVYRFFNTSAGGHLYTINSGERDLIIDTLPHYSYEGIKFHVHNTPVEGTTPVFRFFNNVRGGHLYTISETERDSLMALPQWDYEGIKFYVYVVPNYFTIPVHRFFNNVRGGHLYTISETERDSLMALPQWDYEGIKFLVLH